MNRTTGYEWELSGAELPDQRYRQSLPGLVGCLTFETILCLQDTTSGVYDRHRAEPSNGLLARSCLSCTISGVSLGLLEVKCWSRNPEQHGQKAKRRERRNRRAGARPRLWMGLEQLGAFVVYHRTSEGRDAIPE